MRQVGDDLELTCRASGCPVKVVFVWNTIMDRVLGGASKDNENFSQLLFSNISTKHQNIIVCRASCHGTPTQKTSELKVYCEYSLFLIMVEVVIYGYYGNHLAFAFNYCCY